VKGDPDGATLERIDELARTAARDDSDENLGALWRAVLALEQWWFAMRWESDAPKHVIGAHEGRGYLFGFTCSGRANEFAVTHDLTDDEGHTLVLSMTPDAVIDAAAAWAADGIYAITFDHDLTGFHQPVANLEAFRARIRAE
jgi:hypothetical protein